MVNIGIYSFWVAMAPQSLNPLVLRPRSSSPPPLDHLSTPPSIKPPLPTRPLTPSLTTVILLTKSYDRSKENITFSRNYRERGKFFSGNRCISRFPVKSAQKHVRDCYRQKYCVMNGLYYSFK